MQKGFHHQQEEVIRLRPVQRCSSSEVSFDDRVPITCTAWVVIENLSLFNVRPDVAASSYRKVVLRATGITTMKPESKYAITEKVASILSVKAKKKGNVVCPCSAGLREG